MERRKFILLMLATGGSVYLGNHLNTVKDREPEGTVPVWLPPVSDKYEGVFRKESANYPDPVNLSHLAKVTTCVESGYHSKAISDEGAEGLMQIMPGTAKDIAGRLGVNNYNMLDPEQNIQFGVYLLAILKKYYETGSYHNMNPTEMALWAYHDGMGNVQRRNRTENGFKHNAWVMGMYRERFNDKSPTYLKWLTAVNYSGGLHLRRAFEEQGLSYENYIRKVLLNASETQGNQPPADQPAPSTANKNCVTISPADPSTLPQVVQPGDTLSLPNGGRSEVIPLGGNAYREWVELGKPPVVTYCK